MEQPLLAHSPYVRKPTALIHFERELSVIAQKVMTLIVAHCQKATKNAEGFYLIEKRQVCEFLGWEESYNYLRVIEAFEEIYNNSLIWNLFGQDRTFKYLKCKLIVALLVPTETSRFIGFALYPLLEPVILSPKVFGQILFEAPALLTRSEYAFPIYELLADHVSREEGLLRVSLADLKRYLGLKGRYSDFTLFTMRVLKPSLESINTSTDIQVCCETWRTGRGVGGLIFHIQRTSQSVKPLTVPAKTLAVLSVPTLTAAPVTPERSLEEQAFVERLARHNVSEADALHALQQHGLAGALDIFGYVRQEVARRKGTPEEIRNGSAYLVRCFREGYGRKGDLEREAERVQAEQAERTAVAHHAAQATQAAKDQAAAQINETTRVQIAEAMARWVALPKTEQATLEQRFLQEEPLWVRLPMESMTRIKAFQRWLVEQRF